MKRIFAAALALISVSIPALLAGQDAGLCLVKDGQPRSAIVLAANASLPERHAAEELSHYLAKVSGADVPIVPPSPSGANEARLIYVGVDLPTLPESQRTAVKGLSDEGFLVWSDDKKLVITARKPLGVLYGAYAFLEKALGVRWLTPGEEGEYCPERKTITLQAMKMLESPFFVHRVLGMSCTNINAPLKDTRDWMVRNRMQLETADARFWKDPQMADWIERRGMKLVGGGHVLASFVPVKTYYESHPEYFSLVDGERRKGDNSTDEHGNTYQRCTSNPAVIGLGAKYIENFFGGTPPGASFLLGNNDGGGWCECPDCKALDDPQEAKDGIVTTRFFHYINAVTAKVLEAYPDKEMWAWAYQLFREPPKGVKPDPRIAIQIAMHGRCYRHSLDDPNCPANAEIRRILKEWRKFPNTAGAREYYSCVISGYMEERIVEYLPLEDLVARDIKYLAKIGCRVWEDETPPPDGVFGPLWDKPDVRESWQARFPMYYVAAKLLWDPKQDAEALKDEAYRLWYGPAFEEMKAYRNLLAQAWSGAEGHFIYRASPLFIGKCLDKAGLKDQLLKLLDGAQKKCAGDRKFADRVAQDKKYFGDVWVRMADELNTKTAWHDVHTHAREGKIAIDGVLDEPDWKAAPVTSGFRAIKGGLAREQTFVRMLHDKDALILGLEMMEPAPGTMKAKAAKRDDPAWADDAVELFIDPNQNGSGYYHIAINSKGVIYDSRCTEGGAADKKFNGEYEVKTKVLDDRWIVEVRIPFKNFHASPVEGDSWKVGIARGRTAGAAGEASTWTDGHFHQMDSFRTVVFGDRPPLVLNGGFEEIAEVPTGKGPHIPGIPSIGDWELGNTPNLVPLHWALHGLLHDGRPGKLTLANDAHSGKWSCQVEDGLIYTGFDVQPKAHLVIRFWSKGEGQLQTMLFQYADKGEKNREGRPTVTLEKIDLTGQWQEYTLEHPLDSDEVNNVAVAFDCLGTVLLDDVSVKQERE